MEPFITPLIILGVTAIALLVMYNKLVGLRNTTDESWSGIDTELKRRYDLIPNLVEAVRGYAKHEQSVLESVTQARAQALASHGSPRSQARDENAFVGSLKNLFAVAENYPDLKADKNFLSLQHELINTENRIQAARRFYNGNVRDYNNVVQMFPSNLLAGFCGFKEKEFFEIEDSSQRLAPKTF